MHERYIDQVRLLLSVLPDIAAEEVFALKGGTAINLFYRAMPRLSVDIDLTYLPVGDRETSLQDIDETLDRIMSAIAERNRAVRVERVAGGGNTDTRVMVRENRSQIKIETSPVTRGALHPPVIMTASDAVMDRFGFVEMSVLAFEDLYGGKLHAALDRQHPRDLFDVKLLYENEGVTGELFRAFMVYVASSSRPIHELLAPRAEFNDALYNQEFIGMTREPVTRESLIETRARLHADIRDRLTGEIAAFLLSLHDAEPDFAMIGLPRASLLPAIRWKLLNLRQLKNENPEKHLTQRRALEDLLR